MAQLRVYVKDTNDPVGTGEEIIFRFDFATVGEAQSRGAEIDNMGDDDVLEIEGGEVLENDQIVRTEVVNKRFITKFVVRPQEPTDRPNKRQRIS